MEASPRGLRVETLEKLLQHVNPTHSDVNCVVCAMAVDDSLSGRATVAGPTPEQPGENVRAALSHRTTAHLADLAPAEIERLVDDAGRGAVGLSSAGPRTAPATPTIWRTSRAKRIGWTDNPI